MKYLRTLVSAILGGACIGLGATAYLSCDSIIAGAVLFAVGLFVICAFNLDLFTGQISYIIQNDKVYAISMPIMLGGNLFGAWLIALFVKLGGLNDVVAKATLLTQSKLDNSLIGMFVLAILCNIMIYIAVQGFCGIQNYLGKMLAIFLGVTVFVVCGFEHSIADMAYFSLAGLTWSMVVPLLVIVLGNAVGGVVVHNVYKLLGSPTGKEPIPDEQDDQTEFNDEMATEFENMDSEGVDMDANMDNEMLMGDEG